MRQDEKVLIGLVVDSLGNDDLKEIREESLKVLYTSGESENPKLKIFETVERWKTISLDNPSNEEKENIASPALPVNDEDKEDLSKKVLEATAEETPKEGRIIDLKPQVESTEQPKEKELSENACIHCGHDRSNAEVINNFCRKCGKHQ
jgi:hypothetical protein